MYTLAESVFGTEELKEIWKGVKKEKGIADPDLDIIFTIALKDRALFPLLNIGKEKDEKKYLESWGERYIKVPLPSKHIARPKTTCNDPAIREIVKHAQDISDATAKEQELHHNLFMSAENIQGLLLEEYIALQIRPAGFLWCKGECLHSVDFCNISGTCLLQIKNKNNTENSSSSAIREGTTIQKWYRLKTKTKDGKKYPEYMWTFLNEIVNRYKTEDVVVCMSEDSYQSFLNKVAETNSKIITSL